MDRPRTETVLPNQVVTPSVANRLATKSSHQMLSYDSLSLVDPNTTLSFGLHEDGSYDGLPVTVFKIFAKQLSSMDRLLDELNTLHHLRHPNVLLFLGACTDEKDNLYLVSERPGTEKLDQILSNHRLHLSWQAHLLPIAMDVCRAMVYLHAKNRPHGNLTSASILLSNQHYDAAKVMDTRYISLVADEVYAGLPTHSAPDYLRGDVSSSEACDVYSFGMVLWELCTRREPYAEVRESMSTFATMDAIANGRLFPGPLPSNVPAPLAQLVAACLAADPSHRPVFREVLTTLDTTVRAAVASL
ncbi:TKL protein kinase [Saprolegnia diclina VS20]|uniref:TKL protein kinase n=1 Tax=Saprolegnia diclina (strain VS20) TaxID=1156394 RepID=T0RN16_SAPDV|nr:TKL protein kinase [Saprolegnia diclina VS20]EQC33743.1 TKL protein kinase [Saprolegnia diclina VS20]|eukprot:XP_008612966.1 TKL protein kinase [Saprolegnia diclina VS20]